jgi:hypothetical protein
MVLRAEAQQHRDQAAAAGTDTTDFDELITRPRARYSIIRRARDGVPGTPAEST